jgi:hypothetical protein
MSKRKTPLPRTKTGTGSALHQALKAESTKQQNTNEKPEMPDQKTTTRLTTKIRRRRAGCETLKQYTHGGRLDCVVRRYATRTNRLTNRSLRVFWGSRARFEKLVLATFRSCLA